jgi:hypothetical protein
MSPGGVGCDIKHNSYDRYLNRIKGKAPLRRGVIPVTYGDAIKFNRAYPIYGGKTVKTSIVNGCNCPINNTLTNDARIFKDPNFSDIDNVKYIFNVGDQIYTFRNNNLESGIITKIENDIYTVKLEDNSVYNLTVFDLMPYFNCNCNTSIKEYIVGSNEATGDILCSLPAELIV